MANSSHVTVSADGSWSFDGGVDSQAVTTIRSALIPHGLMRNQLAWADNCTMRGGGILQRAPWIKLLDIVNSGLYQGGILYEPFDDSHPYLIVSVSGHIYKALLDAPFTVTDLSVQFGVFNNANTPQAFFCEGAGFLVIQSGDGVTLPLIYAAAFANNNQPEFLRRSVGIISINNTPAGGIKPFNEIPAATAMVFYGNRIWYAQGRIWSAGDIEDDQASGTPAYQFSDSVLKVTENPLAFGGDGFRIPSTAGQIRALAYTANVDTTLGQGPLYIFTRKQVFSMVVPATRTAWIAANNANQPIVTVSQINNGTTGERSVVHVNGDLFYQSFDPAVRSLIIATRFYQQWGNLSISNNVNRALQFNDRALMKFASGIQFDNRLLECVLPIQTPSGVVCQGILPLDFDLVSTLQEQAPPAWEGIWEGVDVLQLFTGDFGGLPRAFAVILSRVDQTIDCIELVPQLRFENFGTPATSDNRVNWFVEFPAFTWGKEMELKDLMGGELWIDKLFGTVDMKVEWRPDADPCWKFWFHTCFCSAKNCAEDVNNPVCYPLGPQFREGYRFPIVFPKPPTQCDSMSIRPANLAFQHQVKITVKGWMRIRGLILFSDFKAISLYEGLQCDCISTTLPTSTRLNSTPF